jgi:hypothetical protein
MAMQGLDDTSSPGTDLASMAMSGISQPTVDVQVPQMSDRIVDTAEGEHVSPPNPVGERINKVLAPFYATNLRNLGMYETARSFGPEGNALEQNVSKSGGSGYFTPYDETLASKARMAWDSIKETVPEPGKFIVKILAGLPTNAVKAFFATSGAELVGATGWAAKGLTAGTAQSVYDEIAQVHDQHKNNPTPNDSITDYAKAFWSPETAANILAYLAGSGVEQGFKPSSALVESTPSVAPTEGTQPESPVSAPPQTPVETIQPPEVPPTLDDTVVTENGDIVPATQRPDLVPKTEIIPKSTLPEELMQHVSNEAIAKNVPSAEEILNAGRLGRESGINLDYQQVDEQTKAIQENIAAQQPDLMEFAKRGVIPFEEQRAMASNVHMTVDDVMNMPRGTVLNAEQMASMDSVVQAHAQYLKQACETAQDSGDPVDQQIARESYVRQQILTARREAIHSETGRALGSTKNPVGPIDLAKLIDKADKTWKGEPNIDQVISAIADMDPERAASDQDFLMNASKFKFSDAAWYTMRNIWVAGSLSPLRKMITDGVLALAKPAEQTIEAAWGRGSLGEAGAHTAGLFLGTADRLAQTKLATWVLGQENGLRAWLHDALPKMPENFQEFENAGITRPIKGKLGEYIGTPMETLGYVDKFGKSANYGGYLTSYAYKQAINKGMSPFTTEFYSDMARTMRTPTDTLQAETLEFARDRTLQADLGPVANWVAEGRRVVPGLRWVVPFLKVSANLLWKGSVEYTPLGALRAGYKSMWGDMGSAEASHELAKSVLGSSIMTAAIIAKEKGLITGNGPNDPTDRKKWMDSGNQPYSIMIGGKPVSYLAVQPFGDSVAVACNFADLATHIGEEDAAWRYSLQAGERALFGHSYMMQASNFLDALHDPTAGNKLINGFVAGIVPQGVAQITKLMDPVKHAPSNAMQQIEAKLPFLSQRVPPAYTFFGDPVDISGMDERVATWNALTPLTIDNMKKDPAAQAVVDSGAKFGSMMKTVLGVKLTPEEYDGYVRSAGMKFKQMVTDAMSSPDFPKDPDIRREIFEDMHKSAVESTKDGLFKEPTFGPKVGAATIIKSLKYVPKTPEVQDQLKSAYQTLGGQ